MLQQRRRPRSKRYFDRNKKGEGEAKRIAADAAAASSGVDTAGSRP